jgi:hypothetical protein
LYEWILAFRADRLPGLLAALELSNDDDSRVGWCTKRLDIDLGHETLTQALKLNLGGVLGSILRALPNLEVLTVANCDDLSWIQPPSWCPKLMFLNWVHSIKCDGVLDSHVWTSFIESHPRLVGANISTTKLPPSQYHSFTHALESWTTPEISPVPIDTTFTSLRRLCINLEHDEGPRRYDRLLSRPVLSLDTLQLNVIKLKNASELNLNLVQPLFQFLPSLRRIDLVLPVWLEHWVGTGVPPTVEVLGVRVSAHKPKRRDARRFLEALSAHGPPLVQVMDARTMEGILLHKEHLARCIGVLGRWLGPDGKEYVLR